MKIGRIANEFRPDRSGLPTPPYISSRRTFFLDHTIWRLRNRTLRCNPGRRNRSSNPGHPRHCRNSSPTWGFTPPRLTISCRKGTRAHGPSPAWRRRLQHESRQNESSRDRPAALRIAAQPGPGPLGTDGATVLRRWNITSTLDFGRIVFALIEVKQMQRTEDDSIDDFRNVYDFKTAFEVDLSDFRKQSPRRRQPAGLLARAPPPLRPRFQFRPRQGPPPLPPWCLLPPLRPWHRLFSFLRILVVLSGFCCYCSCI